MTEPERLRVGVIGCGGIAQMMHLPHLYSLSGLYEIAALCDISPGSPKCMGARFHVPEKVYLPALRILSLKTWMLFSF